VERGISRQRTAVARVAQERDVAVSPLSHPGDTCVVGSVPLSTFAKLRRDQPCLGEGWLFSEDTVHVIARPLTFRLLFLLLAIAVPARAQFDTAAVLGMVRDSSNATVPDATVTLTNVDTGIVLKKTTGTTGDYEFTAVKVGIYVVTAEKPGFSIGLVDNVQAQVSARLRVDLQMTVGPVSERVQVTAATPLMETDSSQRSQIITGEQMRDLPLNGREYSALALLTTGSLRVAAVECRLVQPGVRGNPLG